MQHGALAMGGRRAAREGWRSDSREVLPRRRCRSIRRLQTSEKSRPFVRRPAQRFRIQTPPGLTALGGDEWQELPRHPPTQGTQQKGPTQRDDRPKIRRPSQPRGQVRWTASHNGAHTVRLRRHPFDQSNLAAFQSLPETQQTRHARASIRELLLLQQSCMTALTVQDVFDASRLVLESTRIPRRVAVCRLCMGGVGHGFTRIWSTYLAKKTARMPMKGA